MITDLTMSTIPETEVDDVHDPDFKPTVDLKEMKLPAIMLGRVKALKNLQMNAVKVFAFNFTFTNFCLF